MKSCLFGLRTGTVVKSFLTPPVFKYSGSNRKLTGSKGSNEVSFIRSPLRLAASGLGGVLVAMRFGFLLASFGCWIHVDIIRWHIQWFVEVVVHFIGLPLLFSLEFFLTPTFRTMRS